MGQLKAVANSKLFTKLPRTLQNLIISMHAGVYIHAPEVGEVIKVREENHYYTD